MSKRKKKKALELGLDKVFANVDVKYDIGLCVSDYDRGGKIVRLGQELSSIFITSRIKNKVI